MTALDASLIAGTAARLRRINLNPLVAALALANALLVMGAIFARGFSDNGFRLGSQLGWRFAGLVFFLALAAGPVCRLGARLMPRWDCPEDLSRRLVWGFCASYGVYVLSVFLPGLVELSPGATMTVMFGGGAALVMAVAAAPLRRLGAGPIIGEKTRRMLLGVAAIYFWCCYALMALSRLSGPHRPDAWYGLCWWMMFAALVLRIADRWWTRRDAA